MASNTVGCASGVSAERCDILFFILVLGPSFCRWGHEVCPHLYFPVPSLAVFFPQETTGQLETSLTVYSQSSVLFSVFVLYDLYVLVLFHGLAYDLYVLAKRI